MVFPTQRAVTTAAYHQLGALGDICNIVGIRNEVNEAKTCVVRLHSIRALKFIDIRKIKYSVHDFRSMTFIILQLSGERVLLSNIIFYLT